MLILLFFPSFHSIENDSADRRRAEEAERHLDQLQKAAREQSLRQQQEVAKMMADMKAAMATSKAEEAQKFEEEKRRLHRSAAEEVENLRQWEAQKFEEEKRRLESAAATEAAQLKQLEAELRAKAGKGEAERAHLEEQKRQIEQQAAAEVQRLRQVEAEINANAGKVAASDQQQQLQQLQEQKRAMLEEAAAKQHQLEGKIRQEAQIEIDAAKALVVEEQRKAAEYQRNLEQQANTAYAEKIAKMEEMARQEIEETKNDLARKHQEEYEARMAELENRYKVVDPYAPTAPSPQDQHPYAPTAPSPQDEHRQWDMAAAFSKNRDGKKQKALKSDSAMEDELDTISAMSSASMEEDYRQKPAVDYNQKPAVDYDQKPAARPTDGVNLGDVTGQLDQMESEMTADLLSLGRLFGHPSTAAATAQAPAFIADDGSSVGTRGSRPRRGKRDQVNYKV